MRRYLTLWIFLLYYMSMSFAQTELKSTVESNPTPKWEVPKGYQIIASEEILNKSQNPDKSSILDIFDGLIKGHGVVTHSPLIVVKNLVNNTGFCATWMISITDTSRERILVMKDLMLEDTDCNKVFQIKDRLAKEYGVDKNGHVVASWFSGSIKVLYDPVYTPFGYASKHEEVLVFDKGILKSSRFSPNYVGSKEFYSHIFENGMKRRYADGAWYENGYGMKCLESWLNDNYRPAGVVFENYRCLITTNSHGVSKLSILDTISDDHKVAFEKLVHLFSTMPALSFGFLITTDGRLYSGRFIEASYSSQQGWNLREILKPQF